MARPDRKALMGIGFGVACAFSLGAGSFGVIAVLADEIALREEAAQTDGLVRIEDRFFRTSYEDWVDTEPTMRATVRKIGYGRTSNVEISTTATGTYSSDGLASPHILYPGIESEFVGGAGQSHIVNLLGDGGGWLVTTLSQARSIVQFTTGSGMRVISNGDFTCVFGENITAC